MSNTKEVIHTDRAPKAIGPYSQAIAANGFLFVSGQLGLHPETMELAADVQGQARQALENLKAILEAGGSSLSGAVKTTVLLRDMKDFASVNEIYLTFFGENPPARACYAAAGLPRDALVEIECIATVDPTRKRKLDGDAE
eukprot:TRINITY_DN2525_c0_g4_i1.p1 TRINITY_DN2525_c0_g4~~TRINITY_DN2525_c0_g4_i1.p1  ORF type:complete len:141 (-),score=37.10 TRINITY_DN2525_c0_g4_i1:102-524(-)